MKTFFQILLAVCMLVAGSAKMNKQFHHKSAIQRLLIHKRFAKLLTRDVQRNLGGQRSKSRLSEQKVKAEYQEKERREAEKRAERDRQAAVQKEQERLQKEALKPACPSSVVNSKICNECNGKCTTWCSKGTDNLFASANNDLRCGSSCDSQVVDCRKCAVDIVNQHEQISSNCIKNQTADPIRRLVDCASQHHTQQNTSEIKSSLKPAGCFFDSDTSTTFWNSEMTSNTNCSPTNVCLCNTVQQSNNVSSEPSCYESWAKNTSCTHFLKAAAIITNIGNITTTVKSNNLFPLNCVYDSELFNKLYATEITLIIVGCIGIILILAPICLFFIRDGYTFYHLSPNGACVLFAVLPYWTQTILWVVVYMPCAIYVGSECNTAPDKKITTGLDDYRIFLEEGCDTVEGYGKYMGNECNTVPDCVKVCFANISAIQSMKINRAAENYNICAIFATQSYWILAGKIIGVIGGIVLILICCSAGKPNSPINCCKHCCDKEEVEIQVEIPPHMLHHTGRPKTSDEMHDEFHGLGKYSE